MAMTLEQSATGYSSFSALTVNWPATPTSGNLLVVIVGTRGGTAQSTPTGYSSVVGDAASLIQGQMFVKVSDGTETGVTFNVTNEAAAVLLEYSGNDGATANATASTGVTTSPTSVSPAISSSVDELLLGVGVDRDGPTSGMDVTDSGFTRIASIDSGTRNGVIVESLDAAGGGGTQTVTFTGSTRGVLLAATFPEPASGITIVQSLSRIEHVAVRSLHAIDSGVV